MKVKVLYIIISFSLGFGIGWWIANSFIKPEIRIVETSKTNSKYIKQLNKTDYEALWGCYSNPISIYGMMNGNIFEVCATDECKESRKNFDCLTHQRNGSGKHCIPLRKNTIRSFGH